MANAKKIDKTQFMLMDRKGESLQRLSGDIGGRDFVIDGCENCDIFLLDHLSQIFVDYCKGCNIMIGPVNGSVFVRNCEDCRIQLCCGQLRTRDCVRCDILISVPGRPTIEASEAMRFGPLLQAYPEFHSHAKSAGIAKRFENGERCEWSNVYDFSTHQVNVGHWACMSKADVEAFLGKFPVGPVKSTVPVDFSSDDFASDISDAAGPKQEDSSAQVAKSVASQPKVARDSGDVKAKTMPLPATEVTPVPAVAKLGRTQPAFKTRTTSGSSANVACTAAAAKDSNADCTSAAPLPVDASTSLNKDSTSTPSRGKTQASEASIAASICEGEERTVGAAAPKAAAMKIKHVKPKSSPAVVVKAAEDGSSKPEYREKDRGGMPEDRESKSLKEVRRCDESAAVPAEVKEECSAKAVCKTAASVVPPSCCDHCGASPDGVTGLLLCAGCRAAWYCSPVCQRAAWKAGHKKVCRAAR